MSKEIGRDTEAARNGVRPPIANRPEPAQDFGRGVHNGSEAAVSRDAAAALSLSMALFAASEKDASRHSTFMRLHMACNDCALGLKHALDTAPTKVQK
jgi:hypothetical protein